MCSCWRQCILGFFLSGAPLAIVLAVYIVLQLGYCFGLKHQMVLDIVLVSSGFLLRAIAGGVAADVPLSQWFLLVMAFGSIFMASGKRYAEKMLADREGRQIRKVLQSYTATYLRFVWTMSATALILCYSLWAFQQGRCRRWSRVRALVRDFDGAVGDCGDALCGGCGPW